MMTVVGGNDINELSHTTELFDATTGQWFKCDDLPQPLRCGHSVIVDDTLYVLGGLTDNKSSTAVYASPVDALFSHQLKWQRIVDTPCSGPAAVGLNNKYLLVLGEDGVYSLNSTATAWMSIAVLPLWTRYATVVCNDNSKLVMLGGFRTNKVWVGSFLIVP